MKNVGKRCSLALMVVCDDMRAQVCVFPDQALVSSWAIKEYIKFPEVLLMP
jgi:hypothetical protein